MKKKQYGIIRLERKKPAHPDPLIDKMKGSYVAGAIGSKKDILNQVHEMNYGSIKYDFIYDVKEVNFKEINEAKNI